VTGSTDPVGASPRLWLDHVVLAVADLDAAAERLRRKHGLDSAPGGRHPGWGTRNRIVPLGEGYLELIGVADRDEAARSAFGRSVLERTDRGDGWLTLCAATDDLEAVARRLGLEVMDGSRERPDGTVLRWRSAGLEDPRRAPWMPFFIQWVAADPHPGRVRAGHGIRPAGLAWVRVGGDAGRLRAWLGDAALPIRVTSGPEGVQAVGVRTAEGELEVS
jgi:hypothetical protein